MADNFHEEVLAVPETTKLKRKCKCCGQELPLSNFKKKGTGHRNICISCERNQTGVSDKFKNFTDRDLMEELRSRGYKGTLKRIRIENINL